MKTTRKRKQPIIMIADPDEEERTLLRAILKLIGFRVVEAWDGQQAITLAQRESPDVLVIDLTLPKLGGSDALEGIRRQSALPNLPIVAISPEETTRRAVGSATVFLPKPIEYEQLYVLIDRFLPGQMTARARSKCLPL